MERLAGIANPFGHTIVTDPWQAAEADVPGIHARAFEACRPALESVRTTGRSTAVILHGEAGSGKTHLLSRLRRRWAATDADGIDTNRPEMGFVAVRLQTGPRRLWRYLRRSFADDLLRTHPLGGTQLERILLLRLAEVRPAAYRLSDWW